MVPAGPEQQQAAWAGAPHSGLRRADAMMRPAVGIAGHLGETSCVSGSKTHKTEKSYKKGFHFFDKTQWKSKGGGNESRKGEQQKGYCQQESWRPRVLEPKTTKALETTRVLETTSVLETKRVLKTTIGDTLRWVGFLVFTPLVFGCRLFPGKFGGYL